MNRLAILLGLSGSEQSRYAAELSWELAKKTGGTVTAQHVIDVHSSWAMLRFQKPGFIGSGLYINAYETINKTLESLANKLMEKYEAMADGAKVEGKTVTDSGNPVHEVCKRALDHHIVIVGHQPISKKADNGEHAPFERYAIAEEIARVCPRPLLVCQGKHVQWKTLKIMMAIDHLNLNYVHSCVRLAALFGLEPHILCLATGAHEEFIDDFKRDIRSAHPDLNKVPIDARVIKDAFVEDRGGLWQQPATNFDFGCFLDELIVVPTRQTGDERITLLGSLPYEVICSQTLPNILLWPEEYVLPELQKLESLAKAV